MTKAKTPEDDESEVEPLADPEPDIPPAVPDPDEGEPDEKAAFGIPPPEKPPSHVLRDEIRERAAARSFDMSGPHHQ